MAIVFIDTNIVIEYLKNNLEVVEVLARYEKIYINDVVIMELYQGARDKRELNFIKNKILTFAPKPKHFLSNILQHSDDTH